MTRIERACAKPVTTIQYADECWPIDSDAERKLDRLERNGQNDFARHLVLAEMGYDLFHESTIQP